MAQILLAEDDDGMRTFLAKALKRAGHEVAPVADGHLALRQLESATFDLLIADIVMPVMDGVALALKASEEYPALRIIIMTGYRAELGRAHNLGALIHGILAKPFAPEELRAAAAKALAGAPARNDPTPQSG